jgi:hypothetical protein
MVFSVDSGRYFLELLKKKNQINNIQGSWDSFQKHFANQKYNPMVSMQKSRTSRSRFLIMALASNQNTPNKFLIFFKD